VKKFVIPKRAQTLGEEIANSISHGVGLVAAIIAAPFLLVAAIRSGSAWTIVGASVFAASMVLLYLSSTLYHAMRGERAKRVFQVFDHVAIYLLIAGTYTPFTLGVMRGAVGWTIFGLIWGLAVLGIFLKAIGGAVRAPILSIILYLGMGWLVVLAIHPLLEHMPLAGLWWLLAGGMAYSLGVAAYAAVKVRYAHFVWHLCVIAGTVCHFVAVIRYAS
jgi:hemolysin III